MGNADVARIAHSPRVAHVAEPLNFRHAANALGVSLSSVSARVKTLEEDLGVPLFERHARGVRLTEAGRRFVEHVAAGVDQLDHAVKTADMAASGECGRLRIRVHALIPGSFLAALTACSWLVRPSCPIAIHGESGPNRSRTASACRTTRRHLGRSDG